MFVPRELLMDIRRHGQVDVSFFVVPIECNSTIKRPTNILNDFVVLFEGVEQMLEVFVANILNTKVIDREVEPHGSFDMFEKAGSVRLFEVTVWCQARF